MKRLHFIADSLNIQYKSCVKKDWSAFDQTIGFDFYETDTNKITKLILAFKNGESLAYIQKNIISEKRYSLTDTSLVIRSNYYNEDTKTYKTQVATLGNRRIIENSIDFDLNNDSLLPAKDGGYWIYCKNENWYDSKKDELTYFYVINPFQKFKIPSYYNDFINYSQCIVDTNTDVYAENAESSQDRRECYEKTMVLQKKFISRIDSIIYKKNEPIRPQYYRGKNQDSLKLYRKKFLLYISKYLKWEKEKVFYVNKVLHKRKDFDELALNAWKEASDSNCYDFEFIDNLAKYYSQKLAFHLKRSVYPIGISSLDSSPREYLIELAILAADVGRWDVFLRAHLNMMNDYARRNSDNSMAARNRGVYIKELDQLPINLDKMFIGMLFRIDNAPKFHYYNTLTRSATAMALSRYQMKFKSLLFTVLSDRSVDTYNRVVFAYTYLNFLERLELKEEKLKYEKAKLLNGISDLPAFLRNRFKKVEEN